MAAVMMLTRRAAPALAALALLALTSPLGAAAAEESGAPAPEMHLPFGPGGLGFSDPLPPEQTAAIVAAAQEVATALGLPFGPYTQVRARVGGDGRAWWSVDSGKWTYEHGGDTEYWADPVSGGIVWTGPGSLVTHSSFTLDRETKALLSVLNFAASKPGPPGPFLSEAEAIARATAALEAVGRPADIALEGAELTCAGGGSRPTAECGPECTCGGSPLWRVTWNPLGPMVEDGCAGFLYERSANQWVELNARTGELTRINVRPPPRPPTGALVVAVSQAQAEAIALAHVAALWGRPVPRPVVTTRLGIAQTYLCWSQPGQHEFRYDDPSRLVWTVDVATRTAEELLAEGIEPTQCVAYVDVDAATGAVVGDARSMGRLRLPERDRPPAPASPARRASSGLPLVLGGGVVAAWLLGSLFIRRRARPR